MRKIYRLIVIVIVAIIGASGCATSTDYGIEQTDFEPNPDSSYDGQADKDMPDGTTEGYPLDSKYGMPDTAFVPDKDMPDADSNGYANDTAYAMPQVNFNNDTDKQP